MPRLVFFSKIALNGEYVNNGYSKSSLPFIKTFTIMLIQKNLHATTKLVNQKEQFLVYFHF